jgi:RimJ/RimL family protein N-acetyltransferase
MRWPSRLLPRGCGAVFSFDLKGSRKQGQAFIEALKIFSHLANVGDCRSLVIHPASTTHFRMDDAALAAAGITPGHDPAEHRAGRRRRPDRRPQARLQAGRQGSLKRCACAAVLPRGDGRRAIAPAAAPRPATRRAIFAMASDAEVMRYMDWPAPRQHGSRHRPTWAGCAANAGKAGTNGTGSSNARADGPGPGLRRVPAPPATAPTSVTSWRARTGARAWRPKPPACLLGWLQRQPQIVRVWATTDHANARSAAVLRKTGSAARRRDAPSHAAAQPGRPAPRHLPVRLGAQGQRTIAPLKVTNS